MQVVRFFSDEHVHGQIMQSRSMGFITGVFFIKKSICTKIKIGKFVCDCAAPQISSQLDLR